MSTVVFLGVQGEPGPPGPPPAGAPRADAVPGVRALSGLLASELRLLLRLAAAGGDDVRADLTLTTLLVAVHADELGRAFGLPPGPTLREIAERVDDPWRTELLGRRQALLAAGSGSTALPPALVDFLL